MNFKWGKKFFPLTNGKKLSTLAITIHYSTLKFVEPNKVSHGTWKQTHT